MRVRIAGCHVPADPGQRMGESGSAAADGRFSEKGPVIGDGSQSREKRQSKSIRGRAMCRNSHTKGGTHSGRPYEDSSVSPSEIRAARQEAPFPAKWDNGRRPPA